MKKRMHWPLRYKKRIMSPVEVAKLFRRPWINEGCPFKSWSLRKRYRWCLANRRTPQ